MKQIFPELDKKVIHQSIAFVWCLFYLLLQIKLFYPGQFFMDSNSSWSQYNLDEYNNWHPPLLTIWWHLFHIKSAVFLVHLSLILISLLVILILLIKNKNLPRAYMVIGYFSLPLIFRLFSWVLKDIGMIAGLLSAVMLIILLERSSRKFYRYLFSTILILTLYYSCNIRANGIFAVFPIMLYMFFYLFTFNKVIIRLVLLFSSMAFFVLINNYVTYNIFKARDLIPSSFMLLTDLARIECSGKVAYKVPDIFFKNGVVDHKQLCNNVNSPTLNEDVIFETLIKNDFWESNSSQLRMTNDKYILLKKEWSREISNNLLLYAQERLKFFTKIFISTRFTLDASHPNFGAYPQLLSIYVFLNVVINYIVLILGFILPFYCIKKNKHSLTFFVSLSGWVYLLGWIPLAALGETRYFIWFFISQVIAYSIMPISDKKIFSCDSKKISIINVK